MKSKARNVPSGVSLPISMLERIDEAAEEKEMSRSEFIRHLFRFWEEKGKEE